MMKLAGLTLVCPCGCGGTVKNQNQISSNIIRKRRVGEVQLKGESRRNLYLIRRTKVFLSIFYAGKLLTSIVKDSSHYSVVNES